MGLKNKGLILYFMLLLGIIGMYSYSKLSQSEDPPFTFKVMVVQTYWPGATAKEVSLQVTDRIERADDHRAVRADSGLFTSGRINGDLYCQRFAAFRANSDIWYTVRKKINDIRHELPQGVQGPFLTMNLAIPSAIFMC